MGSTAKERFDQIERELKSMAEDNPGQIFNKLNLYLEAKDIACELWAVWSKRARDAKSTKKEVINHVKIYGAYLKEDLPMTNDNTKKESLPLTPAKEPTTDKMREAIAELIAKPYEDQENSYLSAAEHYKTKNETITEKIQVLKKKYDHLKEVAKGGV